MNHILPILTSIDNAAQDEEDLLQDGLTCIALMKEVVMQHLNGAIPSLLTALNVSKRRDAAATLRELLTPIILDSFSTDSAFASGSKYQQISNPAFVGLKKSISRDKSDRGIQPVHVLQPSPKGDVINLIKDVPENSDWSENTIWRDFLCRIIVHFWQHFRNRLTIEECRDEFLSSAKKSFGYGTHKYNTSAVKIIIQSLQPTSHQHQNMNCRSSTKSYVSDIDENNNSISPKPLIWASVESYLTCQNNEEVSQDLKERNTIKKTLQLSICCENIVVNEITIVQVNSMFGNNDVLSSTERSSEIQKIMLSDIVCWGYNDQSIAIKFKQRGNGHEASYYSDDEDEDAKNTNVEVSDVIYHLIYYPIGT